MTLIRDFLEFYFFFKEVNIFRICVELGCGVFFESRDVSIALYWSLQTLKLLNWFLILFVLIAAEWISEVEVSLASFVLAVVARIRIARFSKVRLGWKIFDSWGWFQVSISEQLPIKSVRQTHVKLTLHRPAPSRTGTLTSQCSYMTGSKCCSLAADFAGKCQY